MEPLAPVYTAELFPALHQELLGLLRRLEPAAWLRPTIAGRWRVRDIVAHLLDGDLRRLSAARDGHALTPDRPVDSYEDALQLINELNATGVRYAERLSPQLLVDLLAISGHWVAELFAELPPHADATFPVAWAGEDRSANWMDIGRDYTERWHHQMQIRDAVGAPGLLERRWMAPLLDLSVRALPRAYAATAAPAGTGIVLMVTGDAGGTWSIVREDSRWGVYRGASDSPAAIVRAAPDDAWRLLYNALAPERAREVLEIDGDFTLAEPLLGARSVMV